MNHKFDFLKNCGMVIVGAGLAGLLAANFFRRYKPVVIEVQPELPNNHLALLRFRSDAVSRITGIPFKKVLVRKGVFWGDEIIDNPSLQLSNLYSHKVTGKLTNRSLDNIGPVERYIAPMDFISQAAGGVRILYRKPLDREIITRCQQEGIPIISTIPMASLMRITGRSKPNHRDFKATSITSLSCDIGYPEVDLNQTIYHPSPDSAVYRSSLIGNHFIAEFLTKKLFADGVPFEDKGNIEDHIHQQLSNMFPIRCPDFEIHNMKVKTQNLGKLISPSPEIGRKFIYDATVYWGVYSLGRFATWRQILLDDCVQDCEIIQRMIQSGNYLR